MNKKVLITTKKIKSPKNKKSPRSKKSSLSKSLEKYKRFNFLLCKNKL